MTALPNLRTMSSRKIIAAQVVQLVALHNATLGTGAAKAACIRRLKAVPSRHLAASSGFVIPQTHKTKQT